ncbi:MAG: cytochrome c-type biogenesis protein CcmH [Actinomycetota bacterium]|nr:cytochrome c-type biogenesis protein CcmH [Actinomycetota bacterium]
MRRALLAALAAALLVPAGAVAAACPQTSVGELEDQVQCLECGVPLELATESPQANRQRALIGRLADSCRSEDEIKDRLVAEFGPRVLTTPEDEGFDLVAWLVPMIALLVAATGIGLAARRWRRSGRDRPVAAADSGHPPEGGRLDADLDRYDL